MKAKIQIDNLGLYAARLKKISNELEEITSIYRQQVELDSTFMGPAVTQYRRVLNELLNEHQKTIELYDSLSKQLNEMKKDFLAVEESLLVKIGNL